MQSFVTSHITWPLENSTRERMREQKSDNFIELDRSAVLFKIWAHELSTGLAPPFPRLQNGFHNNSFHLAVARIREMMFIEHSVSTWPKAGIRNCLVCGHDYA